MIIMFVRHAEADGDELTNLGEEQCRVMCLQDEDYKFSKIYCSPISRCRKTAKFLQDKYSLSVEILANLKDREVLKGKPETEQEKEWYDSYLNKTYSSQNPEGCKEFLERNFKEFDYIINKHKDKKENIILVAHSCTFYALQEYLNASKEQNINYSRLANCARVYFEIN